MAPPRQHVQQAARLLSLPEYSIGFLGAARLLYRKDGSSLGALGAADAGDAGDVDLLLVQVQESHPNKGLVTLPSSFSAEWSHENASPSGEPGTVPDSSWCASWRIVFSPHRTPQNSYRLEKALNNSH